MGLQKFIGKSFYLLGAAKQLRRNGDFSTICGVFSFNLWGFPLTARGLVPVVIFRYSCRIIKQLKTVTRPCSLLTCGKNDVLSSKNIAGVLDG